MMPDVPAQTTWLSRDNVWLALAYLVIILFAVAFVVPNLVGTQGGGPRPAQSAIAGYENAVKLYAIAHNGEFPTGSSDEVTTLLMSPGVDASGKRIPSYLEKPLIDPWGQPLHYEWPNRRVEKSTKPAIWSNGLNQQDENGEGDDVTNWSEIAN